MVYSLSESFCQWGFYEKNIITNKLNEKTILSTSTVYGTQSNLYFCIIMVDVATVLVCMCNDKIDYLYL